MRYPKYAGQWATAILTVTVAATSASAQTRLPWDDRGVVHVSIGAQTATRTHTAAGATEIYEEQATFTAPLRNNGSTMVDLMGAVRLWKNVGAGIGFSRYADSSGTLVDARIPDPLFFDTLHDSSVSLGGLDHSERAVHLSAVYMMPLSGLPLLDRLDVLVYAGPSFFSVSKDVVNGISVPAGSSTIGSASLERVSESGTGGHFGVDLSYPVTSKIGAGLFLRGASASVDVPAVEGGSVDVGGFSYGVGVRVKF
jgi:hypothetical protein